MAQHILTRPVFEALFEHYDFAAANPVARALDALREDFGEFGLENEVRDLERFYESVRMRARGLDKRRRPIRRGSAVECDPARAPCL